MKKIIFAIIILTILCFTLTACTTKIADIKANPDNYLGKQVSVSGTVKNTMKLGEFSGYNLADADGNSIFVSSKSLPAEGAAKVVTGTIVKFLGQPYIQTTE